MYYIAKRIEFGILCKIKYCLSKQNYLSTSITCNAGSKFRRKIGKAIDGSAFGPLTDLPDWTYVNKNEPPVVTKQQKLRQMKQVAIATRINKLLEEIEMQKNRTLLKESNEKDNI
nr:39S ribosomal protein L52, mitochondrial-like [Hydra vulgaris]